PTPQDFDELRHEQANANDAMFLTILPLHGQVDPQRRRYAVPCVGPVPGGLLERGLGGLAMGRTLRRHPPDTWTWRVPMRAAARIAGFGASAVKWLSTGVPSQLCPFASPTRIGSR